MFKLLTAACNVLWMLSALPGWLRFQIALRHPKRSQQRILTKILNDNAGTRALTEQPFHQRKPQEYEDFYPYIQRIMQGESNQLTKESPLLLEPTGGSTVGSKLIPYTAGLKKEFHRAVNPWVAGLFFRWPSLLLGRHYWCITPSTTEEIESVLPIGFETDADYLGSFQKFFADRIFAVPHAVTQIRDPEALRFQTLVHLLNTPDFRLISVWHPSLLVLMLETLEEQFDALLAELPARRARQLSEMSCTPARIWKKLRVISCWDGPACEPWTRELRRFFPNATIQPKGLLATEGITSFPLGSHENVAAVRSHYYEFQSEENGDLLPLWELEAGKTYSVVLTTGGGFIRYRTHDRVKVTGFLHRTPCLQFLNRDNQTSDLVGEKISQAQALEICNTLPCHHRFAMIAPEKVNRRYRYVLYIETMDDLEPLRQHLEQSLSTNFHYRHARSLGQLAPADVQRVKSATQKVYAHLQRYGQQQGNIKLTFLRKETDWGSILKSDETT